MESRRVMWGRWEIRGSKWDHHDAAGQTGPYRSSVRQCTRPAPFEPRLPPARTHEMKGKFSAPSSTFAITQRQKQQMHHVYTAWERRYCYIWFESDRLARTSHCSKGNKSGMFYAVLFQILNSRFRLHHHHNGRYDQTIPSHCP